MLMQSEIKLPPNVSQDARQFIRCLLGRRPEDRFAYGPLGITNRNRKPSSEYRLESTRKMRCGIATARLIIEVAAAERCDFDVSHLNESVEPVWRRFLYTDWTVTDPSGAE